MPRPTPSHIQDAIVREYLAGESVSIVADRYDLSKNGVRVIVKRAGHPLRKIIGRPGPNFAARKPRVRPDVTALDIENLRDKLPGERTYYKVAKFLGMDLGTVCGRVKRDLARDNTVSKRKRRPLHNYDAIVQDFEAGMTQVAIAKKRGCSRKVVWRALRRRGVKAYQIRCHETAHPLVKQLARHLSDEDFRIEDLAKRSGVAESAIRKWFNAGTKPWLDTFMAVAEAAGCPLRLGEEDYFGNAKRI